MYEMTFEQGSVEWHRARQGIVTGTTLKQAVINSDALLYQLVSENMTEAQMKELNVEAVNRGNDLEPHALRTASKKLGIHFSKTGMLMSSEIDGFGISPDGVYKENGRVIGGIEIKCPDSKKHVEYLLQDKLPKEYRHQVLAPFIVSDQIQWWYFMSFDDRNYEKPDFYYLIHRSDVADEIIEIKEKLKAFIQRVETAHTELTF